LLQPWKSSQERANSLGKRDDPICLAQHPLLDLFRQPERQASLFPQAGVYVLFGLQAALVEQEWNAGPLLEAARHGSRHVGARVQQIERLLPVFAHDPNDSVIYVENRRGNGWS